MWWRWGESKTYHCKSLIYNKNSWLYLIGATKCCYETLSSNVYYYPFFLCPHMICFRFYPISGYTVFLIGHLIDSVPYIETEPDGLFCYVRGISCMLALRAASKIRTLWDSVYTHQTLLRDTEYLVTFKK